MLEIRNVSKKFIKGPAEYGALADVTLSIKKGEYVSVSGPSGSGKSTLLNVIGGLIRPDRGEVIYKGMNIYRQNGNDLNLYRKRDVGFIFQQFHLMPYLTVTENIRLSCYKQSHASHINNYLEKCSLAEIRNKYPSDLSVGEKQRTAFVRAIISACGLSITFGKLASASSLHPKRGQFWFCPACLTRYRLGASPTFSCQGSSGSTTRVRFSRTS
jgi:putative ABC transport system ATP-binding protein